MTEDNTPEVEELTDKELEEEAMPADIAEFIAKNNISDQKYTCKVRQWPIGGGGHATVVANITDTYPSINEVGEQFGPGTYSWTFIFDVKDKTAKRGYRPTARTFKENLGRSYAVAHDEYMFQQKKNRRARLRELSDEMELEDVLDGKKPADKNPQVDAVKEGMKQMQDTVANLKSLGVPVGVGDLTSNKNGSNDNVLVAMMIESSKNLVSIMNNNQSNMMLMFKLMMENGKSNQGNGMTEMQKTMLNMIDFKNALNPEKEAWVDKLFKLGESVAPHLINVCAKPRAEALRDPIVKAAVNSSDMQKLKGDQAATDTFAAKWDLHYGAHATNDILAVAGLKRSPEMLKKMKDQGLPTDPRQTDTGGDQEIPPDGEQLQAEDSGKTYPGNEPENGPENLENEVDLDENLES